MPCTREDTGAARKVHDVNAWSAVSSGFQRITEPFAISLARHKLSKAKLKCEKCEAKSSRLKRVTHPDPAMVAATGSGTEQTGGYYSEQNINERFRRVGLMVNDFMNNH